MTLSLTLFLALLLLLPGFGAYAGLVASFQSATFRPAPPAPNSFISLGLVVAGATAAHTVGLVLGLVGDVIGEELSTPLPNPYTFLLSLAAHAENRPAGILSLLLMILFLTVLTGSIVQRTIISDRGRRLFAGMLYGWLGDIVLQAHPKNRYVTAFVLADMQEAGVWVGYEGVLEDISLSPEYEVMSVTLAKAVAFQVKTLKTGVRRAKPVQGASPIPHLHIAKDRITNIALSVIEEAE